ncbi:S-adenosyl-L-methionine-dependent methyltransferase [Glarea lozoyensis ATCC 20868]|uniref:S-adenosyl-L-methionine-dependent methyltransferase n=1 Tax=Glarea lozoyensis (strain ATCC 20868 / MF5171) TaxID=1116229 RepID=S3D862_GLAL2|nr:S-adenosyl-L-methionine-dependent methyltransferase [Glarea lozoyensis ATCC 20868]EPE28201.1 S-adenosyl-L-methionine-dependent methyltransferase [Glarea lozoyensis ATCC 20868]
MVFGIYAWPLRLLAFSGIFALLFSALTMASPNTTTTPRIVDLAAQISTLVAQFQEHLSAHNLSSPSFAEEGPDTFPPEISHLKDALLDATAEMHELLLDPLSLLFKFAAISNLVSIDAISRYKIPDMIPPGSQISFDEISQKTGLQKGPVRRLLQHAMSMRILTEPEPEMVAHTRISKFMTIPSINSWVNFESRETWPATTRIVDAIQKWPNSQEANETGFILANNNKSVQDIVTTSPERAMRFASGMQAIDYVPGYAIENVSTVYDWASLGNVRIVNVAGSRGQAAIELAKNFGNIRLLVQDSANMIQGAESGVPEELKGRVEFMAHGLFEPQTIKAPVYFFRMAFRSLGDKYAVQVLKAQIPVLESGVKILLQDVCMPEPDTIPLWRERISRSVDLALECFSNGRERYLDEWKYLLAAADKRFVLHRVYVPKDSLLGILEIHWDVTCSGEA